MANTIDRLPNMKPGAATFVIDDGTREYTLTNPYGQVICRLHIRPGDFSIIDRYNALVKGLGKLMGPHKEIDLKSDGTAMFDEDWEKLKQVERLLIQQLNRLFDTDEIGEIFARRNAFSSIGGRFFVERVIDAFGDVISAAMKEEAELSKARMDKYLSDLNEKAEEMAQGNAPEAVSADAGQASNDA